MTNYEKYKDEIVDLISNSCALAVKNNVPVECGTLEECDECEFVSVNNLCRDKRKAWLNAEYKEPIILTEREHAFCVALGCGWIARDSNNKLFIYRDKPRKSSSEWTDSHSVMFIEKNGICPQFDFIQWSDTEPYSIEELLKMPVKENE